MGLYDGPIDGIFGAGTRAALEALGELWGVELNLDALSGREPAGAEVQRAMALASRTSDGAMSVRNIQRFLNDLGIDAGPADDIPGPLTLAAINEALARVGRPPVTLADLPSRFQRQEWNDWFYRELMGGRTAR